MSEKEELITILQNKQILMSELENLVYGSVEIRENSESKLIYVHFRENGAGHTKYVGEYTDDLHNLILNNNAKAKTLKKQIKEINKRLKEMKYEDPVLDNDIKANIDFAKRNLVDAIYKQATLEGIATTFADTEKILEGGRINKLTIDEAMKIINLKHAWEFILNENVITCNTDYALLCQINKLVEEGFYYSAGYIRKIDVSIGGTNWKPEIPIENVVKEEINRILNSRANHVEKAIKLLLYAMKKQIFIDGNKRSAVIFANHYLISKGKGILSIPVEANDEFKDLLIDYYTGKDTKNIKDFLIKKCYHSI